jgi:HEAT repeat protein
MEATIALWRISRKADSTVPLFLNLLPLTDDDTKWEIFQALSEMGPAAKAAVPALLPGLRSRNPSVVVPTAGALSKIDRKQAPVIVDALMSRCEGRSVSFLVFSPALEVLVDLGPEARRAVPLLTNLLTWHDIETSNDVVRALMKIDPDAAARAGLR